MKYSPMVLAALLALGISECPQTDADEDGYSTPDDCNDKDPGVNPGAVEICDGIDNNCDNVVDDACVEDKDADGDTWSLSEGDCNDNNPKVYPGAAEICDGQDNNCDDQTDEGCGGSAPVMSLNSVGLSQKQVFTLDLDDVTADPDTVDSSLTFKVTGSDSTKVTAVVDASTHVLTLTAASSFAGTSTLSITATDPEAHTTSSNLPVKVHANRSCETTFVYDSTKYGAVSSLSVAGSFNGWSATANPMTNDGKGIYTAKVTLTPGKSFPYKFVSGGTNWIIDPGNPYTVWEGGFENSEVHVGTCTQPMLELIDLIPDGQRASIDAAFQYVDGSDGKGWNASSLKVTDIDGNELDIAVDAFERVIEVHLGSVPLNTKQSMKVYASSQANVAADPLFVPIWVEPKTFSWRDANLYFAFTDRFADGDSSNNSPVSGVDTKANYQGGDYKGLRQKIEDGYFTNLGINAIWLTPILDNVDHGEVGDDGRQYSGYHGYWPETETGMEEHFGAAADLKAVIAAAHARGIRVMFDLVANHVHEHHPYYTAHKGDGWFNAYTLCSQNDNWNVNPIGCWFAPYLPDFDYKKPDALHTMSADAIRYIKEFDIDGYRVDAVKHVENCYLNHLVENITQQIEHNMTDSWMQFYLVGETFVGEWASSCGAGCSQALIKQYVGPHLLDGQFDFPLYWQVLKTFARFESNMASLASMVKSSSSYYGADAIMSPFLGNHDVARFVSHANGNISDMWGSQAKEQGWTNPPAAPSSYTPYQKLQLAFTFLATYQGVPLVYYGDDLGLPGAGDPDNRRFTKWSGLSTYESDTQTYVKKLFNLRRSHEALRSSDLVDLLSTDADVWVYGKRTTLEKGVVAINRSGVERTVKVSVSALGIPSGKALTEQLRGGTATVSGTELSITVPAWSASIYF